MKKILLFVLLIVSCSITLFGLDSDLFTKGLRQSGYITEFELYSNLSTGARSTQLRSDGSLVVFTDWTLYDVGNLYGFGIFVYNANGEFQWHELESIITSVPVNVTVVNIDQNDNIYFLTTTMSGLSTIHYWRLNHEGSITLLNTIENVPHSGLYFSQAIRIANNEIIAIGKTSDIMQTASSACFYRFSSAGDTLRTVVFPHDQVPLNSRNTAFEIIPKSDTLFYVSCELTTKLSSIIEIDNNGNIYNRLNINNNNCFAPNNAAPPMCINETSGELIISYNKLLSNPPPFISQFEIASVNQDSIEVLFDIGPNTFEDIQQIKYYNNSIYIYGILTSTVQGVLQKYSLDGELIWQREQTGANNANGLDNYYGLYSPDLLRIGNDGCIYWSWADHLKLYAIKLLPNGQLANEDPIITPSEISIHVYPNPGKNRFNIDIKSEKEFASIQIISIYNVKGQKVNQLDLSKTDRHQFSAFWTGKDFNQNDCPSGIYFIKSSLYPNTIKKLTIIR